MTRADVTVKAYIDWLRRPGGPDDVLCPINETCVPHLTPGIRARGAAVAAILEKAGRL